MKRVRAFTRVDLLVWLAGSALLVAIVLPVLGRSRGASRRWGCVSNVGGLNRALQQYVAAFHSSLEHGMDAPAIQQNYWTMPLAGYMGDAERGRQCPEATAANTKIFTTGRADMPWSQPDLATGRQQTGGYTINGWVYGGKFAGSILMGDEAGFLEAGYVHDDARPLGTVVDAESFYRLSAGGRADEIPTFADAIWSETFAAPFDESAGADLRVGTGPGICFHLGQMSIARHGKAVNVAFFDGHVERVRVEKLWGVKWQAHWAAGEEGVVP